MLLPANFHTPGILFRLFTLHTMTSCKRKKDLRHKNVSRIQRPLHRDAIITSPLFGLEPPPDNPLVGMWASFAHAPEVPWTIKIIICTDKQNMGS